MASPILPIEDRSYLWSWYFEDELSQKLRDTITKHEMVESFTCNILETYYPIETWENGVTRIKNHTRCFCVIELKEPCTFIWLATHLTGGFGSLVNGCLKKKFEAGKQLLSMSMRHSRHHGGNQVNYECIERSYTGAQEVTHSIHKMTNPNPTLTL
jgi:hypothetical protein